MATNTLQPVYILLDTSGSMRGEPIAAVNVGLASMLSSLRARPGVAEQVLLSLLTFDAVVNEIVPLQPVSALRLPLLEVPSSGPTFLGAALEAFLVLHQAAATPERLPAMLFVMTDGSPTDLQIYEEAIPKVRGLGLKRITGFAAGPKAKPEYLQWLTEDVIRLDTLDGPAFARLFEHVVQTLGATGASPAFAPPPPDLQVVL